MLKYHLYYFDARMRGEVARYLFQLSGEAYQDVRIGFADWPKFKADESES